jgi:hypothetical protein
MNDDQLRRLVEELSQAEKEHLEVEGPLITRLHQAIVALCDHVGIPNAWNSEP